MSHLTEIPFEGSVQSPEKMLAIWRQVEVDIAETGQSYRAPGALEVEFADLDKAHRMAVYWEKRVLAKKGYMGRNIADMGPGNGEDNSTL